MQPFTRLAFVALLSAACSGDPKPGTLEAAEEGERLMREMSDTLAQVQTLRFETNEILEGVRDDGEKRAFHFSRKVTVRRPNGMFLELHGSGGTELEARAFYDGGMISLESDARKVWAQTDVPGMLDEMLDDVARRFSLPLPFADVVYSLPYDAFLGASAAGGFVGRETIDGVECAELAYEDDTVEVRIWLPTSGEPISRMTFTGWNLDIEVEDETFKFEPPEDFNRIAVEEFVAGVGT